MARHRRTASLLQLLARLGWEREPDRWTVQCRDEDGRKGVVTVGVCDDGVTLTPSVPGTVVVGPLEAGKLRAAVRDALEAIEAPVSAAQSAREASEPLPIARDLEMLIPQPRVRVQLSPSGALDAPTVKDLQAVSDSLPWLQPGGPGRFDTRVRADSHLRPSPTRRPTPRPRAARASHAA